jgi:hypothetical protein
MSWDFITSPLMTSLPVVYACMGDSRPFIMDKKSSAFIFRVQVGCSCRPADTRQFASATSHTH